MMPLMRWNRYCIHSNKHMKSLDWYGLSRLDTEQPNIQKFNQIIHDADIQRSIGQASVPNRKRLLVFFQKLSSSIQQQINDKKLQLRDDQMTRDVLAGNLVTMEKDLEVSYARIKDLRTVMTEKQKIVKKLRDKINSCKAESKEERYYCPFCKTNDFQNREIFSQHMLSQHQFVQGMEARREDHGTINHELKEFIMSLKDKEMELMAMILQQRNTGDTQEMQQTRCDHYQTLPLLNGRDSPLEKEQLKSESQFLYFKQSERYKNEVQRAEQQRAKYLRQSQQRSASLRKSQQQLYKKDQYYEVFKDIQENSSSGSLSGQQPTTERKSNNLNLSPRVIQYQVSTQGKERTGSALQISNYLDLKQRPYLQSESLDLSSNHLSPFKPGQPQANRDSNFALQVSNYEILPKNLAAKTTSKSVIKDEEIQFVPVNSQHQQIIKSNITESNLSNPREHKAAQCGKNQHSQVQEHSLLDHSAREKSTLIIDLSDSLERKDFELSKDDLEINLSDLRLSKLDRMRNQQKVAIKTLEYNTNRQGSDNKFQSLTPLRKTEATLRSNTNYLKEFERKLIDAQCQQSEYQPPPIAVQDYENSKSHRFLVGSGVLGQFIRQSPEESRGFRKKEI